MKFRKTLYAGLLAAMMLLGVSCTIKSDDIRLEEVYGVEVDGVTLSQARLHLNLELANDSRVKVTLRDAKIVVTDLRGDILTVTVEEAVTLPKRSLTDISLPLIVRFNGGLGAVTGLSRLGGNPDEIRFSGSVRLKGSGINKTYRFDDFTMRQFMELIGVASWDELMDGF